MKEGQKFPWGDKEKNALYNKHLAKGHYKQTRTTEEIKQISKSQNTKWTQIY